MTPPIVTENLSLNGKCRPIIPTQNIIDKKKKKGNNKRRETKNTYQINIIATINMRASVI